MKKQTLNEEVFRIKDMMRKLMNEDKTYHYNDKTLNKKGESIDGSGIQETLTDFKINFEMRVVDDSNNNNPFFYEYDEILVSDSDDNIIDVPENDVKSYLDELMSIVFGGGYDIYEPLKGKPCKVELITEGDRIYIDVTRYDEIGSDEEERSYTNIELIPLKYSTQKLPKTKMDVIKGEKRKEIEDKVYRDSIDKFNKNWDDDNRETYRIEAKYIDDSGEESTMFYGVKADSESDAIKKGKLEFRKRLSEVGNGLEKIISIKISDKDFSDMDDEQ